MPVTRATRATSSPITQLVMLIDEAFDESAWHGPNLRGTLRGVTPAQAVWRGGRGRNTVWELVLHTAYWKYTVRRRLTGERHGRFARPGSNFFERPDRVDEFDAALWKADVALLVDEHRQLRDTVSATDPRDLDARPTGSRHTRGFMIRGIASHDLYHAGQIQLLKKLSER
jgi:DinB superfamily